VCGLNRRTSIDGNWCCDKYKEFVLRSIDPNTPVHLIGWDGLKAKGIRVSKPTIYRKVKEGKFPAPIYVSKFPAWIEREIDDYLLALAGDRAGQNGGGM
jgi:predicted DNA-binding transcriptional regulator AlpA